MSRTEDLTAELASLGDGATREELLDWSQRAAVAMRFAVDRESTVARDDYVTLLDRKQAGDAAIARVAAIRDQLVGPYEPLRRALSEALDGAGATGIATPSAIRALSLAVLGDVEFGSALLGADGGFWDTFFGGASEADVRRQEGPNEDGDEQVVAIWRPKHAPGSHRLGGSMTIDLNDVDRDTLRGWAAQLAEGGHPGLAERIYAVTDARAERTVEARDLDPTFRGWEAFTPEGSTLGVVVNVTHPKAATQSTVYLHVDQDGLDEPRRVSLPPTASVRLLAPLAR